MSSSNQAIVVNDLLSFFSCKVNDVPRSKLIKSIREYYSEGVILKAQKILLESVPVKKSTRHHRRLKHPDPLEAMYETFQLIPSEDLPIFVCRNLNNVPHLEHYPVKEVIKEEMLDERELTIEEEYENSHQDIKDEQIAMKSQIADITDVVKQIKDQLKHIVQQQPSPSKPNNLSINGTKRRKSYLKSFSNPNKKFNALQIEPNLRLKKNPKTSMAYIQKLIDEEADVKSESQYEDSQKDEYSDYLDELSEDEEKFVQSACEVVLQENLEGLDQINLLKGTPVKMQGEKIIYIKNEEEDFDFDNYSELQMDDENSIEISSADHFSSFDEIDSSNRGEIKACGEVQEGEIKTHTINEDDPLDPTCPECGIKFVSDNLLSEHVKRHVYKFLFECALCGLKFRSKDLLRQHYTECVENSIEKYGLSDHRCPVPSCGRMYAQERALKQHLCMHSESRHFVCMKCGYRYLTETALNLHVKTQHNPLNKYNCPFCNSSYFNFTGLKNHIRSHTGERPYECNECAYKASTPDLLKRHMLKHRPPQLYVCDICNQEFLGNAKLSRHKVKEHKKENIICRLCSPPKVFNNSCVYNRHYKSHTGERQFECNLCSYAAMSKEVLMAHQKTHVDGNLYCPQCNVPIGTKYSLKRHLKSFCKSNVITYEYVY